MKRTIILCTTSLLFGILIGGAIVVLSASPPPVPASPAATSPQQAIVRAIMQHIVLECKYRDIDGLTETERAQKLSATIMMAECPLDFRIVYSNRLAHANRTDSETASRTLDYLLQKYDLPPYEQLETRVNTLLKTAAEKQLPREKTDTLHPAEHKKLGEEFLNRMNRHIIQAKDPVHLLLGREE